MAVTPRKLFYWAQLQVNQRRRDVPVLRTIKGVPMLLPRRHGLPYFEGTNPLYADNLIQLAKAVSRHGDGTINLLDVGANVGDTAMLVLDQVPGTAVCLEADPRWHPYLERNVGSRPGVTIVQAVLVAPGTDTSVSLSMRTADLGSSIVVREEDPSAPSSPAMTTDDLVKEAPVLEQVRLIKSDTDGYDIMLVHAYLETFAASKPVLFFEYDPRPTRLATPEFEPRDLWPKLHASGYEQAVAWDNAGRVLLRSSTAELFERSVVLEETTKEQRGYGFWDVAVVHRDDPAGGAILAEVARA